MIASGTIPENAGTAFLVSSQRELVETFGTPTFYEVVVPPPIIKMGESPAASIAAMISASVDT